MKKTLTISHLFLTITLIATAICAATAYAADSYYIEIGKPSGVEEARAQWNDLSKKYKSMLGKLTFYPKSVIDEQGETNNIIQAGPITEKEKAQKICNKLFAKDIPCFVLEGIENSPPTMSIGISQASNATSSSGDYFSFPWKNVESAPQESDRQNSSTEANVDVAQAIAVPLSSNSNDEEATKPEKKTPAEPLLITENRASPKVAVKNFSTNEFRSRETGGLIIKKFPNEKSANKFWNYVNDKLPDLVDGLNVRIQRSLLANNSSGVQIKVYPFPNGEAAASFCAQAVNDFGEVLECHYDVSNAFVSNVARAPSETTSEISQRTNSYVERRQLLKHGQPLQRRLPSQQAEIQESNSSIDIQELPEQSDKIFWAQVAIADNKDEANHRWEDIKKKNAALIKGISSKLTSSSSAYAKYSVRLGSFDNEDEANKLCDKLQLKGVDCLVVSTK